MRTLLHSTLAVLFGLSLGCSVSSESSLAASPGGASGSGGEAGRQEVPEALSFEPLRRALQPREEIDLTVIATPPRSYRVRFSLPVGQDDNPSDAVLNRSEAETDESGKARVLLTAPSTAATFSVRASVEGTVTAQLGISVSDAGVATVQVQPLYTGYREPKTWVATARAHATCAERPGIPSPDGALMAFSPATQVPVLQDVPAGIPVAITLRSGHYLGGCASIEMLPPGPADRPQVVEVTVLDRPIELAASELSLALGLSAADTAWSFLTKEGRQAIEQALLGASTSDVDALLDAMRDELSGSPRESWEAARQDELWDTVVSQHWGSTAGTRLRTPVLGWLATGALAFAEGEHVIDGYLSPVDAKSAQLSLTRVAGISAADAGFVSPALVGWSAKSDDTLVLGTDLYVSASRLSTGLGQVVALAEFPEASSAAEALALELGCADLGSALEAAGPYAACDARCFTNQCEDAVAAIWLRGREATTKAPAKLGVTAAGAARVGDAAQVAGVSGSWVGKLTVSGVVRPTGGPLLAAEPPVPTK